VGYLVTVLWAGVLADRARRRTRVLLAGEAVGLAGALGFAVVRPQASLVVLLGFAVLLGISLALSVPAWHGLVPRILERDLVRSATALSSVTSRVAGIVGPAAGGVLVAAAGPRVAFGFDAATFLVAAANLARIDEPPAPSVAHRPSVLHEAREGLREVRRRPWAAAVMVQGGVQLAVMVAPLQVLVPLALDRWHELSAYGPVLAAQSAGSVLAGVVLAHRRPRRPGESAIGGIVLVAGVFCCLALHAPLWLLSVATFVQGAAYSTFVIQWYTALQTEVPGHLVSRFLALSELGEGLGEPAGLAATVPAVVAFGLGPVAWFGAVATVVTTLPVFAVPGVRDFSDPRPEPTAVAPLGVSRTTT
jgi:hypothetical protein